MADAKAARAYAKAQRPWFRKKRYILPLGLVLLMIVASAGSGGGAQSTGGGSASIPAAGAPRSVAGGDEAARTGTVGQAVANAGTTYTVTDVETTDSVGDEFLRETADGTFVIVSLELTNNKDETKTFTSSTAKVRTADGNEYEPSDKAVLAFGDEDLLLKDIQPDLTTSGKVAFDLPPSKISGSTLVIEDFWGQGEVEIDLGL